MSVRSGEAANAEEITQQSVWKEEPAYRRYEARQHMHTQRERHKEYNSINKNATVTNNEQPTTFTKGYKVTLYSDSLRETAL